MPHPSVDSKAQTAIAYGGAVLAGFLLSRSGMPMPWLIGPMLFIAAYRLMGFDLAIPKFLRPTGQIMVAAVVGMSFTISAVAAFADHVVAMALVVLATIVSAFAAAITLRRLARIDIISACIASVPGGPVEMAAFAERFGVAPAPIAFVQTLRIALLVLTIPPILLAISGGVTDLATVTSDASRDIPGMLFLFALALSGSATFYFLGLSSPFFLGALAFSATASALSLPVAMPPNWLLATAQALLGISLGTMFDRAIFIEMRSFLLAACASTAVLVLLSVATALCISSVTGIEWETMILATSPGSVTEMALTARLLHQDVALVTAFHLIRIFTILPLAPFIFAATARLEDAKIKRE